MIIKEMFYTPIKLKPELAQASMTTSDVNNQWRSNFQQQIILTQKKFTTKNSTTVKPVYAVTSIKQPPALKGHLLLVRS
jgi:hypothetical protein